MKKRMNMSSNLLGGKQYTYGQPYSAKEVRHAGIAMIVMGLVVALFGLAVYLHGSGEEIVHTHWGTELINATSRWSPVYVRIIIAGGVLSVAGIWPLAVGIRRLRDGRLGASGHGSV